MLLVVLLASPLHRYLAARSSLQHAEQQSGTSQRQLEQLQGQSKQLSDPAYIEQQARIRLQYALPGETVYTITKAGQQPGIDSTAKAAAHASRAPGDTWNSRLWGSVRSADGSG